MLRDPPSIEVFWASWFLLEACAAPVRKRYLDQSTGAEESEWFRASHHGEMLSEFCSGWTGERCWNCVDVFSASGMFRKTFQKNGLTAVSYDIQSNCRHDICTKEGFLVLLTFGMEFLSSSCTTWYRCIATFLFLHLPAFFPNSGCWTTLLSHLHRRAVYLSAFLKERIVERTLGISWLRLRRKIAKSESENWKACKRFCSYIYIYMSPDPGSQPPPPPMVWSPTPPHTSYILRTPL